MTTRRAVWQAPTTAMLWEIWGQHKASFAGQAAALATGLLCVVWKRQGVTQISGAFLGLVCLFAFLTCILQLLVCFGYVEVDARKVHIGFPARLLLRPVATLRLALTPMFVGGAALGGFLWIWIKLVLQPIGLFPITEPLWLTAVTLSFFWWIQTVSWSLPTMPGRSMVVIVVAVGHLAAGIAPQFVPFAAWPWRWPLLLAVLIAAMPTAVLGLGLTRQGKWEGPAGLVTFWRRLVGARPLTRRRRFASPFWAQFWLEWRRQGILLPAFCGGLGLLVLPVVYIILGPLMNTDRPSPMAMIGCIWVLPLVFSGVLAMAMGKFDQVQPTAELPVYIAIRPMTNGGFLMAKLAMALASSGLAWGITIGSSLLWFLCVGSKAQLLPSGFLEAHGRMTLVISLLPAVLLLILITWKNLLCGLGAGLTGRPWINNVFGLWRPIPFMALLAAVVETKINPDFFKTVWRWLPGLVIVLLTIKIVLSIASFMLGVKRNALTRGAIGWLVGGWLGCGIFLAAYAGLVCLALNRLDVWVWLALAGFLTLPLADLALAPLALAWNRHR